MDEDPRSPALLVADEPMQQLIMAVFGTHRLEFQVATGVQAAIERAHAQPPALVVVVGTKQPRRHWADTVRGLRREPCLTGVAIMAIGLESEAEGVELAAHVGADCYFRLPFPPYKLLLAAQELLGRVVLTVLLAALTAATVSIGAAGTEDHGASLAYHGFAATAGARLDGVLTQPLGRVGA